jgi:hypothetical protein
MWKNALKHETYILWDMTPCIFVLFIIYFSEKFTVSLFNAESGDDLIQRSLVKN